MRGMPFPPVTRPQASTEKPVREREGTRRCMALSDTRKEDWEPALQVEGCVWRVEGCGSRVCSGDERLTPIQRRVRNMREEEEEEEEEGEEGVEDGEEEKRETDLQ